MVVALACHMAAARQADKNARLICGADRERRRSRQA
jgi:hypothetical protein